MVVGEVSVRQDDGLRIVNSLSIFLESFPQEGSNDDQVYLIAYDQGHTQQTQTRKNQAARVFFNVQSGKLEFDTLVQIVMPNKEFDIIYDLFPYQNTIIVSGRIKESPAAITLSQGRLDLNKKIIDLNPNFKTTPIKSGAININPVRNTYNEFDIASKTLRYYKLTNNFSDVNWISKLVDSIDNLNMPQLDESNIWIKGFQESQFGGVI